MEFLLGINWFGDTGDGIARRAVPLVISHDRKSGSRHQACERVGALHKVENYYPDSRDATGEKTISKILVLEV